MNFGSDSKIWRQLLTVIAAVGFLMIIMVSPVFARDQCIQPIPFSPEFRAVSGANYYYFELFKYPNHEIPIKEIIERDDRIWLGEFYIEFRSARKEEECPYFQRAPHFPILKSNLIFSHRKAILRDFTLTLDRKYTLGITPCLSDDIDIYGVFKDCNFNEIKKVTFKTPGAPPTRLEITSETDDEPNDGYIIPVSFSWDHMRGVNSFKIQIYYRGGKRGEFVTELSNITIGYPYLLLDRNYTVKVWSCVDRQGKVCADKFCGHGNCLPAKLDFKTFILDVPDANTFKVAPLYEDKQWEVKTRDFITFDWGSVVGAAYYQIKIIHGETFIERIVDTNQFIIHQRYLEDLGYYTWQVRACIDPDCRKERETTSDWSSTANFELLPPIEIDGDWFGLVVCGRLIDNPHTGWNEREACTIRHIPLMAHVLIDFALFDVVPLIIVVLIMLTGFFYYTAFANAGEYTQITPKVKKMWKAFGIGFFILFFGFTIINILLGIIEFNVDIVGRWYEI